MSKSKEVIVRSTVQHLASPWRITSKSKTVQEWLESICLGNQPALEIEEFRISLYHTTSHNGQPANEYYVSLWGVNTSQIEANHSYTRIDFKPSNMYFKFPRKEYKHFTKEQMQDELTLQVKAFTLTGEFKNSFLSKANIGMSFTFEPVWVKK